MNNINLCLSDFECLRILKALSFNIQSLSPVRSVSAKRKSLRLLQVYDKISSVYLSTHPEAFEYL